MEIIQNYVGFNEDTLVDETEEEYIMLRRL